MAGLTSRSDEIGAVWRVVAWTTLCVGTVAAGLGCGETSGGGSAGGETDAADVQGVDGGEAGLPGDSWSEPSDGGGEGDGSGGGDTGGGEDADGGDGRDVDGAMMGSQVPSSWVACESTADCPIQGTTCVKTVAYNRPDHTGRASVEVAAALERVPEGQGVCTRPCSTDPSVCSNLKWKDAAGETATARCHVLERGASPYELVGQPGFEEAMKKGRAFAAVCLPPIEASDERPGKVCKSCKSQGACGSSTACVNLNTETKRQDASEKGASICAARCEATSECALGFECVGLGGASTDEAGMGDSAMMDGGAGDVGMRDGGSADVGTTDGGMADAGNDAGMNDDGSGGGPGYCLPVARTCDGCRDVDGDGRGAGHCGPSTSRQTEVDCDDRNPEAYYDSDNMEHPWPAYCGPADYNCDGTADAEQVVGHANYGEQHCGECGDACAGSVAGGGQQACVSAPRTARGSMCEVVCDAEFKSADCNNDPADGCELTVKKAKNDAGLSDHLYYPDTDGDGYGVARRDADGDGTKEAAEMVFCSDADADRKMGPGAWARQIGDCAPGDPNTHPGAAEICDGKDNACQSNPTDAANIDEGCDKDGDGYCDALKPVTMMASCMPGDCDDADADAYPGAAGQLGPMKCTRDADGDGYGDTTAPFGGVAGSDCDDAHKSVNPGEIETCNGVDSDCNGSIDDGLSNSKLGKPCNSSRKGWCGEDYTWSCDVAPSEADPTKSGALSCTHKTGSPNEPKVEAPGFDNKDFNCDGFDRYKSPSPNKRHHAVWVTPDQQGDGTTPTSPLDDVDSALDKAVNAKWCQGVKVNGKSIPCDIFLSSKSMSVSAQRLPDGINVYGGFSVRSWGNFGGSWPSRSGKSALNVKVSPENPLGGLYGRDLKRQTVLDGLKIQSADRTTAGASSVALWCESCSKLWLNGVTLKAGDGAAGRNGGAAPRADYTISGSEYADEGDSCMDYATSAHKSQVVKLTSAGWGDLGNLGAAGGDKGGDFIKADGGDGKTYFGCDGEDGEDGDYLFSRADGGRVGSLEVAGGMLDFAPTDGGRGTLNDGGGGGARSYGNRSFPGSSGGCPGLGGHGGDSGGSSVGLILLNSNSAFLNSVSIQSGAAGDGGDGGRGGNGGEGGSGSSSSCEPGDGGHGAGGDGGGGGAGGHSIGCVLINFGLANGSGFDKTKSCTNGQEGTGGKGGSGGPSPGKNGRSGHGGEDGYDCGYYEVAATFNGSVRWDQSHCH